MHLRLMHILAALLCLCSHITYAAGDRANSCIFMDENPLKGDELVRLLNTAKKTGKPVTDPFGRQVRFVRMSYEGVMNMLSTERAADTARNTKVINAAVDRVVAINREDTVIRADAGIVYDNHDFAVQAVDEDSIPIDSIVEKDDIKPLLLKVLRLSDNVTAFNELDCWKLVANSGKELQQVEYVKKINSHLFITESNLKSNHFQLFQNNGQKLFPNSEFQSVYNNENGTITLYSHGKYGLIDDHGELLIPFKYDRIEGFSDGIAIVKKDGLYGAINIRKEIIPTNYTDIDYHWPRDGFLTASTDNQGSTLYSVTGKRVATEGEYDLFSVFGNKLVYVKKDNMSGLLDSAGKPVLPLVYDDILSFDSGLARVKKGQKWGLINEKGQVVLPVVYDYINKFDRDGVTQILKNKTLKDKQWRYIQRQVADGLATVEAVERDKPFVGAHYMAYRLYDKQGDVIKHGCYNLFLEDNSIIASGVTDDTGLTDVFFITYDREIGVMSGPETGKSEVISFDPQAAKKKTVADKIRQKKFKTVACHYDVEASEGAKEAER